jgi:hypothetical protein
MKKETKMSKVILAKDIGRIVYEMLEDSIVETMPEASEEEREEAKFHILSAMSRSMFN